MADLPVVVLRGIFDFLSIPERLRLRSTCKAWKFVIETFDSPRSLNIHSARYPYNVKWCFSDRIVAEDEMLYLNRQPSRRFSLRMEFFRNLQSLHLYHIYDTKQLDLFLEEVNSLSRLKVLMISKGPVHLKRLSSSSLERLSLDCYDIDDIELDTPNLNALVYVNNYFQTNEMINFRFPLKVKHLVCVRFTSNLSQLKNLETLLCLGITPDFSLRNFQSLKRLEIWPFEEEQLLLLRRIHEERIGLNRNGLELIFSGLREELVSGARNLFLATTLTPAYLEVIERNRSKFVGHVPLGFCVEFETLVQYADRVLDKLFNGCHFRLARIQHSTVLALLENGVPLSRLVELLRRSQTPILQVGESMPSFSSNRVDLPAEFYHQISCFESLDYLEIQIRFENFDFDCLLMLKNLRILRIYSETIPITFICKMLKQFKFFIEFSFDLLNYSTLFHIGIWFDTEDVGELFLLIYGFRREVIKMCRDVDEVIEEINQMKRDYLVLLQPFVV